MYLHLAPYKNKTIFLIRQTLVCDYYAAKILYYFFVYLNDLKSKNQKLQNCRSHWELQLSCKKYFHLTTYRNNIIFLVRQALVRDYYGAEIFFSILTSPNEKTQNYKVVDLIEVYNLHIKIIFIRHSIEGFSIFWNLSLITWQNCFTRDEMVLEFFFIWGQ